MKKVFFFIIGALSFCTSSWASVMYEWQYTNDQTPYNMIMRLVLSDEAVARGTVDLDFINLPYDSQMVDPNGLLELHYEIVGGSNTIHFELATQPVTHNEILQVSLRILDNGILAGKIYANDSYRHIGLEGMDGQFLVTTANSDDHMDGAGCYGGMDCRGATGVFRQVPEPASLGLMVLAMVGMALVRWRKV